MSESSRQEPVSARSTERSSNVVESFASSAPRSRLTERNDVRARLSRARGRGEQSVCRGHEGDARSPDAARPRDLAASPGSENGDTAHEVTLRRPDVEGFDAPFEGFASRAARSVHGSGPRGLPSARFTPLPIEPVSGTGPRRPGTATTFSREIDPSTEQPPSVGHGPCTLHPTRGCSPRGRGSNGVLMTSRKASAAGPFIVLCADCRREVDPHRDSGACDRCGGWHRDVLAKEREDRERPAPPRAARTPRLP